MAPRTQISCEKRAQVIILHKQGYSNRQIATIVQISEKGVRTAIKRFSTTGVNTDRQRSGRPKVTSEREDKFIAITSKRLRTLTAPDIRAELNTSRDNVVSVTTVQRRLRQVGLSGCVAIRKPFLRTVNKVKRLNWAKEHRNWTEDDWKKVLWSDESKFELFGCKRRVFVRRRPTEKMLPQCIQPTVKHGGGTVMVWGCFAGDTVGDLVKIEGILKKEGYHKILMHYAVPSGKRLVGKGFVFQQDNDPKHASKLCRGYLANQEKLKILTNMVWPPQSPDLNPIELLWDELDKRIRMFRPKNETALFEALKSAWEAIPMETLLKLIKRMPKLCAAVIKVRGGYIDENKL